MADCGPRKQGESLLDYDARMQVCEAEKGGGTGGGSWSQPFEFPPGSGRYVQNNTATGELREVPTPAGAGLTNDLRELGLVPWSSIVDDADGGRRQAGARQVGRDPSTALTPEQFGRNVSGQGIDTGALWVDPNTGILYNAQGERESEFVHEQVYGPGGPGGTSDPYADAANARAERALQENIRQNRLQEAQNAIDNQRQRMMMRLEGSQWAMPMGTGGYAPSLGPQSPLIKAGLADPFQLTPVPFNADAGMDQAQIEKDLAMIRGAAGVGG